jgi:hypothetical protein
MATMTKTLRERYIDNEILLIGEIVKDQKTGEDVKILDRGSNYVTVESSTGIQKKWIQDVISEEAPVISETVTPKEIKEDFILLESGQIKLFGFETQNFDINLSQFIIEQFEEFDDLYSKHQIIKLLDKALVESNIEYQFETLEKVSNFYKKHSIQEPLIVEALKNNIERLRLAEIIASIAEIEIKNSPYETVTDAVKVLRKKYTDPKQWQVLWPFFRMIDASGISGILPMLPFKQEVRAPLAWASKMTESIIVTMEASVDELFTSLEDSDIINTFSADELTEAMEVTKLIPATNTAVLSDRAKKLAETIIKRNMFQKSPLDLSDAEKETFDSTAARRKYLVAQLAQKLLPKIKEFQADSLL